MTRPALTLHLADAEAATALAHALAEIARPGDCLLLEGPLGAGKSHLARGIIQALQAPFGPPEDVPSPTYTLVQTYEAGGTDIVHADLYRISDPEEVAELGLAESFASAICLVEWPERLGGFAPAGALHIALSYAGEGRLARIAGAGWDERLAALGVAADA